MSCPCEHPPEAEMQHRREHYTAMDKFSYLGNISVDAFDRLYADYKKDPASVDAGWVKFFGGFEFAETEYAASARHSEILDKEFKVIALIDEYRKRGHFFTRTNPVRERRQYLPTLDIENFGLQPADLNTLFQCGNSLGIGKDSLSTIIGHLKQTYCHAVGIEYMYIREPEKIRWLQEKMESRKNTPSFTKEEKLDIYHNLKKAVGFESFIHKKFTGQKRFSLEGAESLIPALNALIDYGSGNGVDEFIIGMAHRGRLNTLVNVLQKPYESIFQEFTGKEYDEEVALGDVKYHLGFSNKIITGRKKEVSLHLVPNPSHLETVGGIMQGIAHAKIAGDYHYDFNKLLPVSIHGDAAIAGQGIAYELVQMSQLEGYATGGTVHLVINNQIGFTTNYLEARSSTYCTDVGKVVKAPIFHVNGDDVEALIYTVGLALDYRQTFHTDVFIDILCYRRYGHNEGDEPRFTQPVLYKEIEKHPNVRDIYSKSLISEGILTQREVTDSETVFFNLMEEKASIKSDILHIKPFLPENWKGYTRAKSEDFYHSPETGVDRQLLINLASRINTLPADKVFFNKLNKLFESRRQMVSNDALDWAMCELLAYGSILVEGRPVRLSGQDSRRGTFSHRHAALVIEDTTEKYIPLRNISETQASFDVLNSPLSEYGVLGFEYGYALANPSGLTIWEAQFGDFHNVAQVIVDQYICAAEEKWNLMNGLVLYLPHGYEGQGSEHSSARPERFLSLAARNNMQLVNCTTPANLFHVLRRQVLRNFRKPLILFTPKSLLRHPQCISSVNDLSSGKFLEVIDDTLVPEKVCRVIFCTGKIYYEILNRRNELQNTDTAIVRVEQLYPFPAKQIEGILKKYINSKENIWLQEEPDNMGAWHFFKRMFSGKNIWGISRPASGSPASGLHEVHIRTQKKILDKAFRSCDCERKDAYCGMHCSKDL